MSRIAVIRSPIITDEILILENKTDIMTYHKAVNSC